MFGERCTLCGGKLDGRKVCKECGLNNSKSEKYYKINKSSCDGMPMTHVHEEAKKKPADKNKMPRQDVQKQAAPGEYRQAGAAPVPKNQPKKGRWVARVVTAFVVLSVLGTIVGSIVEMGEDEGFFEDSDEGYESEYPYQQLSDMEISLPEDGTDEEFQLPSGKYIVGVHIPAGNYYADAADEYDAVRVVDDEHSIYLYEYQAKEGENYLNDLRLFDGALVEISSSDTICLITENAQTVNSVQNPLTKSYEFSSGMEKTAGVDFEAGVYDLNVTEGIGTVDIQAYSEEMGIVLGSNTPDGIEYRNVVLPENAKIKVEELDESEEDFKITITPSPQVASEDCEQIYEDYYK